MKDLCLWRCAAIEKGLERVKAGPQNWKDVRKQILSPEDIDKSEAWVRRELLKINICSISGRTWAQLAKQKQAARRALSRFEQDDGLLFSVMRECVEALGGELEVVAHFGGRSVRLRGITSRD